MYHSKVAQSERKANGMRAERRGAKWERVSDYSYSAILASTDSTLGKQEQRRRRAEPADS